MALPSKRIAIKDAMGPSGGCQTRIQNNSQEAGSFLKAGAVGARTGLWGYNLHPRSKSVSNRKVINTCIYSVPSRPSTGKWECNYLHSTDKIGKQQKSRGYATCLQLTDSGDGIQAQLHLASKLGFRAPLYRPAVPSSESSPDWPHHPGPQAALPQPGVCGFRLGRACPDSLAATWGHTSPPRCGGGRGGTAGLGDRWRPFQGRWQMQEGRR